MSEPTKGPFKVNQCGQWWYVDDADGEEISELIDSTERGGDKLAHLLAASWDLREALQNLLDRVDHHFGKAGPAYDWKEQEEARAALAKSRGEAQ